MFCMIPYFQILDMMKRKDVVNNRYVRIAIYFLYITEMMINYGTDTESHNIEDFIRKIDKHTGSDIAKIILSYTIMKVVEPDIVWTIVDIIQTYYLVHKNRIIVVSGFGTIDQYNSDNYREYRVCDIDYIVNSIGDEIYERTSPIYHTYDDLISHIPRYKIGEVDELLMKRWDIGHIVYGDDVNTLCINGYIVYVILSQIFAHYPLCNKSGVNMIHRYTDILL